jgi:hypothetical protein
VNQVLEHMTGPERVILHGHSRGGALLRILPESVRLKSPMMWVTNATKNKIVAATPFTPR